MRLLVILLALGFGTLPAVSQGRVTSFLEDADLEGRGIFFVDFEADGTAWIAASDGLYRYDGYRWKRFTSAHGLPSDYVRSVRVTRDGTLWVGTVQDAPHAHIEVRDDGCGFDTRSSAGAGLGLQIMRYRADRIGGRLSVDSNPGGGTTVRCVLQLDGQERERPQ